MTEMAFLHDLMHIDADAMAVPPASQVNKQERTNYDAGEPGGVSPRILFDPDLETQRHREH